MKNKVEIVIVLNEIDQVQVSTNSHNLITNLGILGVGTEIIKQLCGGQAEPVEESKIITPRFTV